MNAGIIILKDGTPCLVYDEPLPAPLKQVEFSRADFQITLVYESLPKSVAGKADPFKAAQQQTDVLQTSKIAQLMKTPKKEGRKLEYPLDHRFVAVLEERKNIAIGTVINGELSELAFVPVVITTT